METTDKSTKARILERAAAVGRLVSQEPEFRRLKQAHQDIGEDREATRRINEMRQLQTEMLKQMERGEEPPVDSRRKLERLSEELQGSTRYQALIAAQANFDRLMEKVQESIGSGIRAGEESRIVIP
jgi:cell fate (sporulation/competence/biofilm development) regulator YlbF (YheA/YmcA/DUF963 family)